eukprot:498634_1
MSLHEKLTVFGWTRTLEIYIPAEIKDLIVLFYSITLRFDVYDNHRFNVLNDGQVIKGKCMKCISHSTTFVNYAQCFNDDGFKDGIYSWSVKYNLKNNCKCYIGISTSRAECQSKNWDGSSGTKLLQSKRNWKAGQIMTVVLDCKNHFVSWFIDTKLHTMKPININIGYYFVIRLCCCKRQFVQVVDCPFNLNSIQTKYQ